MKSRLAILTLTLAAALVCAAPALAAANTQAALAYLRTQQNADGGFGSGFGPDSAIGSTADALLAIIAAGGDLAAFDQGGNTPLTYLAANASSAESAGDLSKLILALVAAGQKPHTFGGVDAVARLESLIAPDGRIGGASDTFVSHLLAVLALKSVGRPILPAAVDLIQKAQQDSGAWAWDGTAATAADTNTTAFAVQALVAAGQPVEGAVARALDYYRRIQNDDGGWPYQNPSDYGTATDANSTAVVIQALLAAGQDPAGAAWKTAAGKTPLAALEALQNPSGAFAWMAETPDDNLLATVQALPALAGKAFPLATLPTTGGFPVAPALIAGVGGLALALAGLGLALRRRPSERKPPLSDGHETD